MRAAVALVILALFAVPIAAGVSSTAAAAAETPTPNATTPTATPTPDPTPTPRPPAVVAQIEAIRAGPYDIGELRQPGVQANDEIPSVRALGDPPSGFAAARFRDPTVIDAVTGGTGPWREIESTSIVRQNRLQLYGSAFGPAAGEYEVVVVYWEPMRASVAVGDNGANQTVTYAGNQTVERQTFRFERDELYTYANVSLIPHFDRTVQVTMWLERGGVAVPGARWTFIHRSNPGLQASGVSTTVGLWGWGIRNIFLTGVVSLTIGLVGARLTLRRTGRGPGYGIGAWLILIFLVSIFTIPLAYTYYGLAAVLANAPYLMGVVIGAIAFAVGLTFHEPVRTVAFLRRELHDARTVGRRLDQLNESVRISTDGGMAAIQSELGGAGDLFDELTDAFFSDLPEVPVVKTGDTYRVPVEGVGPFIARFFAKAAEFDPSEIGTREIVREGRIDDIIHVDPGVDEAVVHKPARLLRALPWTTLKREFAEREADLPTRRQAFAAVLTGVILLAPAVAGWWVFSSAWNFGPLGLIIGLVVTVAIGYTAEDGWIEFSPAPVHYRAAEQHLTALRRAYKEASEQQSDREQRRKLEAMTTKEAREDREGEVETYFDVMYGDKELPSEGGS